MCVYILNVFITSYYYYKTIPFIFAAYPSVLTYIKSLLHLGIIMYNIYKM